MPRIVILLLLLAALACSGAPDQRVTAAGALTRKYSQSHYEKWHVRARATGKDCRVLLVETSIVLDESMVEAMHFGTGPYALEGRGVEKYSDEGGFRGVVYKDPTDRVFCYGDLRDDDPHALPQCR